jgi:pyruvate,water dikinase
MEFVVTNTIQVHPIALVHYNELKDEDAKRQIDELTIGYDHKPDYFINKLSHGLVTLCATIYPKSAIYYSHERFSDERVCQPHWWR